MSDTGTNLAQGIVAFTVALVVVGSGWVIFVAYPGSLTDLLGIVLLLVAGVAGLRLGGSVAASLIPGYNVAEVAVEGPISRDSGGSLTSPPVGANADEIVDQIERADADRGADALLLKLNTPGGEIVPSEDIRLAAERFDGPTIAYATDLCASGGYDIASGCDELWARKGTLVGSIGVIGSRVTMADLADRLGLEYEQLTAGEYKDAGTPLSDLDPDDRAYLQGLIDDYYDQFVETVAAGRDLPAEEVRATEARVYLGPEAAELGLVDDIGTRGDVEDRLAEQLETEPEIQAFEPSRGLAARIRSEARAIAFSLGAGVGSIATGDLDGLSFRR
jgi:protease-4